MGQRQLIVLAGGTTAAGRDGMTATAGRLRELAPGTAVVHHDLRDIAQGVVHRRLLLGGTDETTVLELAHGCVSCTLREDVLPLLRRLAGRADVERIVLRLDPVLEPEQVCFAIEHVVVDGRPVTDAVALAGVVTVLDAASWLGDATSDVDLADAGLAVVPGDERMIAQLVVAQAEFADLVVVAGAAEPWERARFDAVLDRLNPLAQRLPVTCLPVEQLDERLLLGGLPRQARRGRPDSAHAPLLRGQPPLTSVAGIRLSLFTARRPFHPKRLHEAIDLLLDGVVRARGRVWLASRPEAALWLQSAGGGLEIGYAGDWLPGGSGADATAAWAQVSPERAATAAMEWHPRWGERTQELTVLTDEADPRRIDEALRAALLTDAELAAGEAAWRELPDPFGWWHTEPCADGDHSPHRATGASRADEA